MPKNERSLGTTILLLRKMSGLSIKDCAKLIHKKTGYEVPIQLWAKCEVHNEQPPIEFFINFLKAFNCHKNAIEKAIEVYRSIYRD